jgi:hypothetical protein
VAGSGMIKKIKEAKGNNVERRTTPGKTENKATERR